MVPVLNDIIDRCPERDEAQPPCDHNDILAVHILHREARTERSSDTDMRARFQPRQEVCKVADTSYAELKFAVYAR